MKVERIEDVYILDTGKKISYLKYIFEDMKYDIIEKFDLDDNLLEYYKISLEDAPNKIKSLAKFNKYFSSSFFSLTPDGSSGEFYYSINKKNISIAERIQNKSLKELVNIRLYKLCYSLYIKTDMDLNFIESYYTLAHNKFIMDDLFKFMDEHGKRDLFFNLEDILREEGNVRNFILRFKNDQLLLYVMGKYRKVLEP